mgnify:CR=1 FL=1
MKSFIRRAFAHSSLALVALLPASIFAAEPVGLWEFEDPSDLGAASIGSPLLLNGTVTASVDVPGAADVARTAYLTVTNPIGANGDEAATRSNQFTIVIDMMVPDFTDGGADNGNFTGILEFNSGGDGDYFIRKQTGNTELGVAAINYTGSSGTFLSNTWYRFVYAVDNGGVGRSVYLNGVKIGDNNSNNTLDYDRASIASTFGIFQDNTTAEQSRVIVSNIALYDERLSDQEIADNNAAFTAWSGDTSGLDINGSQFSIASMSEPVGPVTANFALNQYTLTVVSAHGSPVPAVGEHLYSHGAEVDASVEPVSQGKTRNIITGWSTTGANSASGYESSVNLELTGDTTLTWNWETQVLLEIDSGAEAKLKPMDAGKWYPINTTVHIESVPGPFFTFVEWRGDLGEADATQASLSLLLDQPRALVADFSPVLAANGTPHWWLDNQGLVSDGNFDAAESSDPDGNGLTAAQEFVAGLPVGGQLKVGMDIPSVASPTINITWGSQLGRRYTVKSAPDLSTTFTAIDDAVEGDGNLMEISVAGPGAGNDQAFFTVEVEASPVATSADADAAISSPGTAQFNFARAMAHIPAGSFIMGEDSAGIADVRPEHTVHLDAFYMDKFEVSRGEWIAVATWANANGYDLPTVLHVYDFVPSDDHPAVPITWYEAVKWCNARSEMEGLVP